MVQFLFSVFDLQVLFKNPFGVLMLRDYSPGSLLSETLSQCFFLFTIKLERLRDVNPAYKFNVFDFTKKRM